jgi:hypothetical protein
MARMKLATFLWLAIPPCLVLCSAGWPAASVVAEFKQKTGGATYSRWLCYTRLIEVGFGRGPNGCTWEEYAGNNWHNWEQGSAHRFDFPDDGTIRFVSVDFVGPSAALIGTPKGRSMFDIEWECPKPQWGTPRSPVLDKEPAWVRLSDDLGSLVFTCGVAHPAAYPLARLQYAWYRRN